MMEKASSRMSRGSTSTGGCGTDPALGMATFEKSGSSPGRTSGSGTWSRSVSYAGIVPTLCQIGTFGEASPFNHICSTLVELIGAKSAEKKFPRSSSPQVLERLVGTPWMPRRSSPFGRAENPLDSRQLQAMEFQHARTDHFDRRFRAPRH